MEALALRRHDEQKARGRVEYHRLKNLDPEGHAARAHAKYLRRKERNPETYKAKLTMMVGMLLTMTILCIYNALCYQKVSSLFTLSKFKLSKNCMPWPTPSDPMVRVSPTFAASS
jgi:hypothetical protein